MKPPAVNPRFPLVRSPLVPAFAVAALALPAAAFADDPVPDGQWRGTASLAASIAAGNTRSETVNLNASGSAITDSDKKSFYGQVLYGRAHTAETKGLDALLELFHKRQRGSVVHIFLRFGALE